MKQLQNCKERNPESTNEQTSSGVTLAVHRASCKHNTILPEHMTLHRRFKKRWKLWAHHITDLKVQNHWTSIAKDPFSKNASALYDYNWFVEIAAETFVTQKVATSLHLHNRSKP